MTDPSGAPEEAPVPSRAGRNLRQQRGYSAMEIWWDESLGYQQREIPASEFYPQPSNPARDV